MLRINMIRTQDKEIFEGFLVDKKHPQLSFEVDR